MHSDVNYKAMCNQIIQYEQRSGCNKICIISHAVSIFQTGMTKVWNVLHTFTAYVKLTPYLGLHKA